MKGDVDLRFIGSKTNLLAEIEALLKKNIDNSEVTFLDLFAGTNIVGDYFKKDYTIYSNDILYFSHAIAKATIENNESLTFEGLKKIGINSPFEYLQYEEPLSLCDYYYRNYTPKGDSMYFTEENGKRIDFIRETIEEWKNEQLITEIEYYYLLSALIEAVPFVSNTTGTYGAFLKHWDDRALKPIELVPLNVTNNNKRNKAFNEDANELVKKIEVDIAYIDTPYNSRQYASNYHVLENIARHNKPELRGVTKLFDWSNLKSDYSMKLRAKKAMYDLIENINAKHIIVSYNNEGIIPEEELIEMLREFAIDDNIQVKRIPYRKYMSKIPSKSKELYELLIYIQGKPLNVNKKNVITKESLEVDKWRIPTKKYIKSPLNYIGGKYRLLKQILPLFPDEINTFVDLFSGGANVGINVNAKKHIFNDMNYKINELFRYFAQQEPNDLVEKIKNRIEHFQLSKTNEKAYLDFRKMYNSNPNPLDLYILVSFSYNYQFRFNNSLQFNNPFGRNRSQFSENMEKNLRAFISRLSTMDAVFTDEFFINLDLSNLREDDFVYLDPPYLITTGNYNDGNRGFLNWTETQELAMYELMNDLTEQGVRYALSNVLEHKDKKNKLLEKFIEENETTVNYLDFNYNNSSHNSKGKGSKEVLITNYNPITYEIFNLKNIGYKIK